MSWLLLVRAIKECYVVMLTWFKENPGRRINAQMIYVIKQMQLWHFYSLFVQKCFTNANIMIASAKISQPPISKHCSRYIGIQNSFTLHQSSLTVPTMIIYLHSVLGGSKPSAKMRTMLRTMTNQRQEPTKHEVYVKWKDH